MFNLPAVAPYRLTRAPLAQAFGQVRFPLQARLATIDGLAAVQDGLRERYPYLEAQPTAGSLEVQFGPNGPQAAFGSNAQQFVFLSDDGYSVHVDAGSVTLSAGASYQGYEDFRDRFAEVVQILHSVVRVPRCDRIAVRYLTLATTPSSDSSAWSKWFRPEFVGWSGGKLLAEGTTIQNSLSQVQLSSSPQDSFALFPADVAGVVRHGLIPGGSGVAGIPPIQIDAESYVVDFDFFCEHAQPWDVGRLVGQFHALHDQIDRFFRWALTDEGARDFGYEGVDQ